MVKFNIEARLHRFEGKSKHKRVEWIRQYARIETAMRRCMEFLILEGEVGDTIEFTLKINSFQVGTIRLKATGAVEALWNDGEAKRLQNEKLLGRAYDTTPIDALIASVKSEKGSKVIH